MNYQVYIDGKKIDKTFKAKNMESIWNQFNSWSKKQGATEYIIDSQYLGRLAWKTSRGIAEIRKV
jgi:hypothetical protein